MYQNEIIMCMIMREKVKDFVHLPSQLRSIRMNQRFISIEYNIYLKVSLNYTGIELTMAGPLLPE